MYKLCLPQYAAWSVTIQVIWICQVTDNFLQNVLQQMSSWSQNIATLQSKVPKYKTCSNPITHAPVAWGKHKTCISPLHCHRVTLGLLLSITKKLCKNINHCPKHFFGLRALLDSDNTRCSKVEDSTATLRLNLMFYDLFTFAGD